ncbi:hypothetical protein ACHAWO_007453 [Cyclotella atomus]|uniref:Peptidase M12B domain-containing protein n=1 Tax=Cyclotella atomus TaxID=382360 RepID=A0ABD3NZJ2_9STRA
MRKSVIASTSFLVFASSAGEIALPNRDLRKVYMPFANQHRIKVPIHNRLLDALKTADHPRHRGKTRHYEVETMDESSSISTLQLQEVVSMAITPQTTYNFKRELDESALDFSILAHHSNGHMTILSVDMQTGRVRGLHREVQGKTSHVTSGNGDTLHMRSLQEANNRKEWTCGAVSHDHGKKRAADSDSNSTWSDNTDYETVDSTDLRKRGPKNNATKWREPQKYSFHIDLSIEVDASFIERQGSAEKAVEYINFLVSASNFVFEHEVDAHLNVVHVEETDRFDSQTNAKEALSLMRMQLGLQSNSTYYKDSRSKFRLHHAVLGRYLGGGIAFIDSICDQDWGFGVTSDISGNLENVDENVLFDFFIFIHEVGHSLGSGHTFDEEYDPPIDQCEPCVMQESDNVTIDGLPHASSATIMSYCNFCDGGLENIALTLGGEWKGLDPRSELTTWENSPFIDGYVSNEPRRVSHLIWDTLSSKGLECIAPPVQFDEIQGCDEDSQCNDNNQCTIDSCQNNLCTVSETQSNCCGNQICETGELEVNCVDCTPFFIEPESYCEECFALDGFMIDLKLNDDADRDIFIDSISFMHKIPTDEDVRVELYYSMGGSYRGREKSQSDWKLLSTKIVSSQSSSDFTEITFGSPLCLHVGSAAAFYLFASRDILLFGQGVYSVKNDHGLQLYSSRAVSGLFGDGVDGFSLSCSIEYSLNDNLSTKSPTQRPSAQIAEFKSATHKNSKGDQTDGSDSSHEEEASFDSNTSLRQYRIMPWVVLVFVSIVLVAIL